MQGHVVPKKTYFLVFITLIALTALTTAVAFKDLGPMNTVAALAIAVCKATLVILFFMHVKYSPGLTRVVIVAAFFWLAILIALTLSDVFTRNWTPNPAGWQSSMLLEASRAVSTIGRRATIARAETAPRPFRARPPCFGPCLRAARPRRSEGFA